MLFKVQILANVTLSLLITFGWASHLFPFFSDKLNTQLFLIAMLLLGVLLAACMLTKLHRIDKKTDKQYRRIENYLATVKL